MTSEIPDRVAARIAGVSEQLKFWWRHNSDNTFTSLDAYRDERTYAERTLERAVRDLNVDQTHKLQLIVGGAALLLFRFNKDVETLDPAYIYTDRGLQPGESLDLVTVQPKLASEFYGTLQPDYIGDGTSYTSSVAIAETLALGGNLALVPQDVDALRQQEMARQ